MAWALERGPKDRRIMAVLPIRCGPISEASNKSPKGSSRSFVVAVLVLAVLALKDRVLVKKAEMGRGVGNSEGDVRGENETFELPGFAEYIDLAIFLDSALCLEIMLPLIQLRADSWGALAITITVMVLTKNYFTTVTRTKQCKVQGASASCIWQQWR
jgi:hypothetical protein